MRICIVTDYYYPQLGGITEHVHGQAVHLSRRGHEVTVLTGHLLHAPQAVDAGERPPAAEHFEVVRMGAALPLYGNGSQTLHTVPPLLLRSLRSFFRRRRFDVVHLHAPYNPGFCLIAPLAIPSGTAGVGTYHSVFTPSPIRDLVNPFTRWSLGHLDAHVVVSEACIPPLAHYFPFRWHVIPNGIDVEHFRPARGQEARAGDELPRILFLGRFDPRNGLGIMLRAFEQLHRARDGRVRLRIVGDGPLRAYYRRQLPPELAEAVEWAGRVDWGRPREYRGADVLCTPCQRASFGMVLLEAMACGTAVVASRISGFELLVEDGREGLLVSPSDDPGAFAAALARVLDDPLARARMGGAGRERAVSGFAWSLVAEQLERLYEELLRGGAPAAPAEPPREVAAAPR